MDRCLKLNADDSPCQEQMAMWVCDCLERARVRCCRDLARACQERLCADSVSARHLIRRRNKRQPKPRCIEPTMHKTLHRSGHFRIRMADRHVRVWMPCPGRTIETFMRWQRSQALFCPLSGALAASPVPGFGFPGWKLISRVISVVHI